MSRVAKLSGGWAERLAHAAKTFLEDNPQTSLREALVAAQDAISPPAELRMTPGSLKQYAGHSAHLRAAIQAAGLKYPARRPKGALAEALVKAVASGERGAPVIDESTPLKPVGPATRAAALAHKEAELRALAATVQPTIATATATQLIEQLFKLQREEITRAVKAEIAERIADAFSEPTLQGGAEQEAPDAATPRAVPRFADKQRCLLVGLYPAQAVVVKPRLAGGACAVRFWTDNGTEPLKAGLGWADAVFVLVKNVSHSTVELIKRGGKPVHYVNGGATDLVAQVNQLLKESANV